MGILEIRGSLLTSLSSDPSLGFILVTTLSTMGRGRSIEQPPSSYGILSLRSKVYTSLAPCLLLPGLGSI